MNRKLLFVILVVSGLMLFGSLYVGYFGDPIANLISGNFFDVKNAIVPCNLCRYIRISSYPIFVLSLIRIVKGKQGNLYEIGVFALFTLLFSGYKYYLEMFAPKTESFICTTSSVSCGDAGLIYMGFITLSLLGIVASLLILGLLYKMQNIQK